MALTSFAHAQTPCDPNGASLTERSCGQPGLLGVVINNSPQDLGLYGWSTEGKIGYLTVLNTTPQRCAFRIQSVVTDNIIEELIAPPGHTCPDNDAIEDGATMNYMAHIFGFWHDYRQHIVKMAERHGIRRQINPVMDVFPYETNLGDNFIYFVRIAQNCDIIIHRSDGTSKVIAEMQNDTSGMIAKVCNSRGSAGNHIGEKILGLLRSPYQPSIAVVLTSGFIGADLLKGFQ